LLLLSSRLRGAVLRGELTEFRHIELERQLAAFSDIQGGCERIKSTPIPHSYNILIHSIVALYVFSLPFGLVEQLHFYTPLMVVIVAYTFLGLDAVGDEIEDPFGEDLNDLPLTTLARMIEVNLLQMLGETEVPELLHPKEGRLN
jgi:putative membrane protein